MFDVFKDIYAWANGIEIDKVEKDKKEKPIISVAGKIITTIIIVLYWFIASINIMNIIDGTLEGILLVKYILLIILSLVSLVLIYFKSRKIAKAGIICFVAFVLLNYFFSMIGF